MKKKIIIGLTGNIGTGKTLFSSFFKKKGIPIYYSDKRGILLMNQLDILKKKIINNFGKESYFKKKLNRNFLSKKIFNNPDALKFLCKIVHPWIQLDFEIWKNFYQKQSSLYLIKESAILFETGNYKNFDFIITLFSSIKKKLERVIKRKNNKLVERQIIYRLNNQINEKKIINNYNNIIFINNNSNIDYLKNKFIMIDNIIKNKINYGKR